MLPDDSPVEFFKTELASESVAAKLKTLKRTSLIAHLITAEQTRDLLLPCLLGLLNTHQDEVLFALAEELGNLAERFDDSLDHLALLISPLETLAAHEETLVRDRAVQSLLALLAQAQRQGKGEEFTKSYLVPVVDKLSKGDWFPARVAACALIAPLYPHAMEGKALLRKAMSSLAADDVPLVKRAAASKMRNIVSVVERTTLERVVLPLLMQLAQNETHDTIRTSAIIALVELSKSQKITESSNKVLETIQNAAIDRSWRVRKTLADEFVTLFAVYSDDISTLLLPTFQLLLQDSEQEIRIAALKSLQTAVGRFAPRQLRGSQLPTQLATLAEDPSPVVRAAVASVIGPLCAAVDRDIAQSILLPIVLDLMTDEFHTVRLNVVRHAGELCATIGLSGVAHSLVGAVESLMVDSQWRVRLAVVNQIPKLAKHFGAQAFQSTLGPLYLRAFCDSVHAVRECAIENIIKIGEAFSQAWTAKNLLPPLLKMYREPFQPGAKAAALGSSGGTTIPLESEVNPDDSVTGGNTAVAPAPPNNTGTVSYLTRMTVLHAVPVLVKVLPSSVIEKDILDLLVTALSDPIANVRFCAAKVIGTLAVEKYMSVALITKVLKPTLTQMVERDSDFDVQCFCYEAIQQIRSA